MSSVSVGGAERSEVIESEPLSMLRNMALRVARVIRLDGAVFREVAADSSATYQALAVVFLSASVTAVAVGASWDAVPPQFVLAYVSWIVGSLLAFGIGRFAFRAPQHVEWIAVTRALGFAHAPLLLRVLALLPGVGVAIFILSVIWQGVAILMALREAVGYPSYWRPVGILAVGFVPYVLVMASLNRLL